MERKVPILIAMKKCPRFVGVEVLSHSFIIRGFAFVGGLHGLFHAGDFFIRQKIEVVHAFLCGEPAIVLQTEADKEAEKSKATRMSLPSKTNGTCSNPASHTDPARARTMPMISAAFPCFNASGFHFRKGIEK